MSSQQVFFTAEIRDEIFCQLCKQTTSCPAPEILIKGWKLIILCLFTFPPTKDFEGWLRKYIEERIKGKSKETSYAKLALKKLIVICKSGPRGRILSLGEIEKLKDSPFNLTPFGSSLEEIMEHQKTKYPQLVVPMCLTVLSDAVIRLGGCSVEGIFRIPGDSESMYELKAEVEKGNYDAQTKDPNVAASLLKLWLRELPEPLIPMRFYEKCLATVDDPKKAVKIVQKLPKLNRRALSYLIKFLQVVGDPANQVKTKMTLDNLAMVFAPNLLTCGSDRPETIFENSKLEQVFVKHLIQHMNTSNTLS
eukprot:TRINITY_DN4223_c0_g1_i4.p1 TRINITY_DN4223_c0_g1~~TRINITY_DN4223_c0_g1_i4.p1  ORF type:complete len:307 (+),score=49.60 TRINITY_DN4223_c0_g1_i4:649-1569(+)